MLKTTLIENKSYEHAGFQDPRGTCPPPPFRGRAGEGVKLADAWLKVPLSALEFDRSKASVCANSGLMRGLGG